MRQLDPVEDYCAVCHHAFHPLPVEVYPWPPTAAEPPALGIARQVLGQPHEEPERRYACSLGCLDVLKKPKTRFARAAAWIAALFVLSGCGGAPFDSILRLETNAPDGGGGIGSSGGAEDSAIRPDTVRGEREASTDEAGFKPDVGTPLEAGPEAMAEADAPEAAPPAESGPACTVVYPSSTTCSSAGGQARMVLRPSQVCVEHYGSPPSYTLMTTPSECRCMETYTCACVLAANPSCPSGSTPSCTFGTMPFLFCPS
jgi:hypothetical protein